MQELRPKYCSSLKKLKWYEPSINYTSVKSTKRKNKEKVSCIFHLGIAIYRNGKIYEGEFHLNEKSGYGV